MAGLDVRRLKDRPHQSSKAAQKYLAQSPSLRISQPMPSQFRSRTRNTTSRHNPARNDIALKFSDPLTTQVAAQNTDTAITEYSPESPWIPASAAGILLYFALNLYGSGNMLHAEEPTAKQTSPKTTAAKIVKGGEFSMQYRDHDEIGQRGNVFGSQGYIDTPFLRILGGFEQDTGNAALALTSAKNVGGFSPLILSSAFNPADFHLWYAGAMAGNMEDPFGFRSSDKFSDVLEFLIGGGYFDTALRTSNLDRSQLGFSHSSKTGFWANAYVRPVLDDETWLDFTLKIDALYNKFKGDDHFPEGVQVERNRDLNLDGYFLWRIPASGISVGAAFEVVRANGHKRYEDVIPFFFLPEFRSKTTAYAVGPALRWETNEPHGERTGFLVGIAAHSDSGEVQHEYGPAQVLDGFRVRAEFYNEKDDFKIWLVHYARDSESVNVLMAGPTSQTYEQEVKKRGVEVGITTGKDFPIEWLQRLKLSGYLASSESRTDLKVRIAGLPEGFPPLINRAGGWDEDGYGIALQKGIKWEKDQRVIPVVGIRYDHTSEGFGAFGPDTQSNIVTLTIGAKF